MENKIHIEKTNYKPFERLTKEELSNMNNKEKIERFWLALKTRQTNKEIYKQYKKH